jgi:putative ABC transport system substrate-binding protein
VRGALSNERPYRDRRTFITLLGSAATWPFSARAQRAAIPVIGFLRSSTLADATRLVTAFREGLKDAGFTEGQNVAVEYRSADNDQDRLAALATDFSRRPVAVIVANVAAAVAAKAATTTVPIVFATGSDPVEDHLVPRLNRPGGNVTGVVFFAGQMGSKVLDLLHQLVPKAATVAVLLDATTSDTVVEQQNLEAAAPAIGARLIVFKAASNADIETAFATFVGQGAGALVVGAGALLFSNRERIVALAVRHAIPAVYPVREFAEAGGLMSYGASISEAYRQVGIYAGRILKGEKPGDLSVMRSTRFELVINLKTAKTLGLTLPLALQVAVDEVIE